MSEQRFVNVGPVARSFRLKGRVALDNLFLGINVNRF